MTTYAIGSLAKLITKNEVTWGTDLAVDQGMDFISESIAKKGNIVERDGIRGTVSKNSEDTRTGPYTVSGQLVVEPSAAELQIWLPRILGTDVSTITYALSDGAPLSFKMEIDRGSKVFS